MELKETLAKWVNLLGLTDWSITAAIVDEIDFPNDSKSLPPIAMCEMDAPHRNAYITLLSEWKEQDLLHELCHILISHTTRVAMVMGEGDDKQMQLLRDAIEYDVDRLARVFWYNAELKDGFAFEGVVK